jgi:soluble lytic murein transglycosylase
MSDGAARRLRGASGSQQSSRRRSRRDAGRRYGALAAALALGLGVAGGLVLLSPVEKAIKEITLPLRHEDIIRQQAREKNLDPALIAAVIYRESKFRDQTSAAGAKGLMQILPTTAEFVARRSGGTRFVRADLADPQINISYGCWYLRYLLDRYDGNRVSAIAAYNAGYRRVDRWGGVRLELAGIAFPETRKYTQDVLEKRDDYARRYRKELGL